MSKNSIEYNKLDLNEVSDLISIPDKEYVSSIPSGLKGGKVCIGTTSINGVEEKVYFNDNRYNDRNLIVSGRMGSGKGQYLKNYIYDCLTNDIPSVIIDYVDNMDFGDLEQKLVDEGKMIVLDINDPDCIQSLSYNELNFDDIDSPIEKINKLDDKSYMVLELLESIGNCELTNSMKKYFMTASKIVYSVNKDASFQNIIDFLEYEEIREDFLNRIPDDLKYYLEDEIYISKKLNTTTVGQSSLDRILDTIYMLKQNMTIKLMMKQTSENNINFTKCLEEGKTILVKLNKELCNREIRDMINVFFIEKVNMACRAKAMQSLDDTKLVHFIINDEMYSDKVIKKLRDIIPTSRVHNLKIIVTASELDRIEKMMRNLGCIEFNYMFLSGLDERASRMIQRISGIKVNDIYDIPRYHSVNLILNKQFQYDLFITKLPDVLELSKMK